jgi:hypothetical protein
MTQIQITKTPQLAKVSNDRNSHLKLFEIKWSSLEESLAVSYKIKYTVNHTPQQSHLPKQMNIYAYFRKQN